MSEDKEDQGRSFCLVGRSQWCLHNQVLVGALACILSCLCNSCHELNSMCDEAILIMIRQSSKCSVLVHCETIPLELWRDGAFRQPSAFPLLRPLLRYLQQRRGHNNQRLPVCHICHNLKTRTWPRTINLLHVLESARGHCSTCAFIKNAILACVSEAELPRIVGTAPGLSNRDLVISWISLKLIEDDGSSNRIYISLFASKGDPCPWEGIPVRPVLPQSTASPASFSRIERWIRECTHGHNRCTTTNEMPLPARLLDVRRRGLLPKLIESSNGQTGAYVCLSHCWGDNQPLTTSKATLRDHKRGIKWESLPKPFQDAISVVRQLGLRFLWIDSLCIIQDDEHGWQMESGKMCDIYRNSFLTIAASKCKTAKERLFSQSQYPDQRLSGVTGRDAYVAYARRDGLHHFIGSEASDICEPRSTYFPLLDRAWVYQERLLTQRMLHFGSQEPLWECMEMSACECSGIWSVNIESPWKRVPCGEEAPKLIHGAVLQSPFSSAGELVRRWHDMVVTYSSLNLSKSSDRLPALSGLAKQMQARLHDQYLAGLWKKSILTDLLWATGNDTPMAKPLNWRAPSWSWASVDASVRFQNPDGELCCGLIDVRCLLAGADPTGAVANGTLVLSGHLVSAKLRHVSDIGASKGWSLVEIPNVPGGFFWPDYNLQDAGVLSGETVYCFKMTTSSKGLVLRIINSAKHVYERIGFLYQKDLHLYTAGLDTIVVTII